MERSIFKRMEEITTINIEAYIQEKYTSRMNTKKKKNCFWKMRTKCFLLVDLHENNY